MQHTTDALATFGEDDASHEVDNLVNDAHERPLAAQMTLMTLGNVAHVNHVATDSEDACPQRQDGLTATGLNGQLCLTCGDCAAPGIGA
eukprot:10782980-Lingulodinium_polyedra.AAC.1